MNRFRTLPFLLAALIILSGCRVEWSSSTSKVEEEEKMVIISFQRGRLTMKEQFGL
ncbi:hypothetical protein Q0N12_11090 [Rossellomorea marisflavi]|uniref:hypothetical protein n=1 Tax=Rossellomorea marisflavi TaxID=189381 RepID=UPI0034578336